MSKIRKQPPKSTAPVIRCAIYTRKSTEEGLEQEFNSLDAQRESGEAYIASQQQEGWTCLPERYDDGGFTGGNLERPAMQRLMADIQAGKIDCVVVYKVDRLSRSLLDFVRLMETFDRMISERQRIHCLFQSDIAAIGCNCRKWIGSRPRSVRGRKRMAS